MTDHRRLRLNIMLVGALATVFCFISPGFINTARAAQPVEGGLIAEIPYRIAYDGWFTVKATVNGEGPYDFIIDTGATLSLVFQKLLDRQQFPAVDQPPRRVLGLASVGTLPVYRIGDIDLGGAALRNHEGVVLANWASPQRTPDGVLGLDFLTRYFIVFDRPTKTLRLYDKNSAAPSNITRWSSRRLRANNFGLSSGNLYTITGRIQRKPVTFILDLGASGTLINSAAFSSLLTGVSIVRWGDRRGSSTRITGAFNFEDKAVLLAVRRFQIGRTTWKRRRFVIYNPGIFEELGVAGKAFGLLGADLFLDRSFAIDFQGERFYIGPEIKNAPRRRTELDSSKGVSQ